MRSVLLSLIIAASIPAILAHPYIGVLVFSWVSYMNPHKLSWGFASAIPWAMIVGAVTFAGWIFSRENKKLPMSALTVWMLVFVVWCGITTSLAFNPEEALQAYIQYLKIMLMTFLTVIVMQDKRRIIALVWVIVGSIGFFGFKGGIFSLLTGGQYMVWGPPTSFIGDNNALALALIVIVPLVRFLQLHTERKWVRLGLLVSIPLLIVSILTSYSRGAFLALVVMTVYLAMKSRHRIRIGALLAVMLVAGFALMPDKYFDRLSTIESYEQDGSAKQRLNAWRFALNVAAANPVFGGGFEVASAPATIRYRPDPTDLHNAHSIYFEVLQTQGYVGLFIFLTTYFMTFRSNRWVIRRTRIRQDLIWLSDLAAMLQVSLIGYAVAGTFQNLAFFDLPWHLVAISVLARILTKRELANPPLEAQPVAPTRGRPPLGPRGIRPVPQPIAATRNRGTAYDAPIRRARRG